MRTLTAISLLLATAALSAQRPSCVYHPDNSASAGGSNVIPFGQVKTSTTWRNQRYQTIIPTSALGNVPGVIQEIAFAPAGTGTRNFDSLRIRLVQTKLSTLSGNLNFDQNLGKNFTTVLDVKNYTWHHTGNTWCRIGLQQGLLYVPQLGNILIDIQQMGADFKATGSLTSTGFRSKSIERMYAYGWTGSPPATGRYSASSGLGMELCFDTHDPSVFGISCAGSSGTPKLTLSGSSQVAKIVDVNLSTQSVVNGVGVLIMGFDTRAPIFPVMLPGNCYLYQSPDLAIAAPIVNGTALRKIPSPNLPGVRYWLQYATLDPKANALGLALTNQGRVLIGN